MALYARPNRPELDAIKVPDSHDIAWAAGIYEGEGTCRLCGKTKRGFMAAVIQKDPELLYWLRDLFGGSIGKPNKNGICTWNICGDRARVFIAQIYSRMTARRKAQIDATEALMFLDGRDPSVLNATQLRSLMDAYYSKNFKTTWRGNAEYRQQMHRNNYLRKSSDPQWMDKIREKNKAYRDNRTAEQKEAARKHRHDHYIQQKENAKVVVMEKAS